MFAYFDNLELPVSSVENISTSYGANFASHDLISRKPKLQYIADSSRIVQLRLRFNDYSCNAESQRKKLLQKAAEHKAGVLAIGNIVLGIFVIASINENFIQADASGRVLTADYDITFKESGSENKQIQITPAVKTDGQSASALAKQAAQAAKIIGQQITAKAVSAAQIVRQSL